MKCFVLCGGFGTRLNNGKPGKLKPAIKFNNKSMIEYIVDIYSKHVSEFYLLGGYKIQNLKKIKFKNSKAKIHILDTGLGTSTGDRLKKIQHLLKKKENFFLTYGDSLANFKPKEAIKLKNKNNYVMSIHKYFPSYGITQISNNKIKNFSEKSNFFYINAGFYIFDNTIFNFFNKKKNISLEKDVIPKVLKKKNISVFEVTKWLPMDTQSDKLTINKTLKKNKNYFKF